MAGLLNLTPTLRDGRQGLPPEAVRLLLRMRAALVCGEVLLLVVAALGLSAHLDWLPLSMVVGLHGVLLVWGMGHRMAGLVFSETLLHLWADAAFLGGVVYFTGGYANPFISSLLVPLILGAVLLPPRHAWLLATWVGLIYTVLMSYYQPLATRLSADAAVHFHLAGMWVNFLLTAILVAAFTGALAAALRRRDADLAHAREQRLRDEQLFALGLQAAAAAHDLATPLASVRLTLDDLRQDFSGDEELALPLDLMAGQLKRVEIVLARLGQAARSREIVAGPAVSASQWLARTLERWGLLHPGMVVRLDVPDGLPMLDDDPVLEAVLMTLLNNAAEASSASSAPLSLSAAHEGMWLRVLVADAGSGLGVKATGWGVGLELAQGALTRLGGRLDVFNHPSGGVLARMEIPLEEKLA